MARDDAPSATRWEEDRQRAHHSEVSFQHLYRALGCMVRGKKGIEEALFVRNRGLAGLGRIPRTLVPKAKALGVRIMAYDPYVNKDTAAELGVEMVGFEQLLRESDSVSLYAALTKDNRHMMGLEQFKKVNYPTACWGVIHCERSETISSLFLQIASSSATGRLLAMTIDSLKDKTVRSMLSTDLSDSVSSGRGKVRREAPVLFQRPLPKGQTGHRKVSPESGVSGGGKVCLCGLAGI